MAGRTLRTEEGIGLAVALAAHAGLIALLVLRPSLAPVFQPPQRIEVMLSDDVGLTSTSPEPNADAAADVAPEIGEVPPVAERAEAQPEPLPKPEPKPAPRNTVQPQLKPAAKTPPKDTRRSGGSRVGSDFLEGVSNSDRISDARSSVASFGAKEQASLLSAISRQLRPYWTAPQGVDAEKLVTIVRFHLARDGSLIGEPQVIGQSGRTDANANQMSRHAEQAIRAVKLAAPFDLPEQFYSRWKTIDSRFDRNLSR